MAALALGVLGAPATAQTTAATTVTAGLTGRLPASGNTPELWPKLAPFTALVVANLSGGTSDEELAATTLEGACNQRQRAKRLYVVWNSDDYGHDIKGAILTNPSDADTVSLATTMAGLDDATTSSPPGRSRST